MVFDLGPFSLFVFWSAKAKRPFKITQKFSGHIPLARFCCFALAARTQEHFYLLFHFLIFVDFNI